MPVLAVNVAVLDQGKILLTKREDFEVWCLPGGAVESGESLGQAAIREVQEETGLEVKLEELVGVYSKLGFINDIHSILFTAKVIGGELKVQIGETIELHFFELDELPEEILFAQNRRIFDAIQKVRGVVRRQNLTSSFGVKTRQDLYALRDQSELSRRDFYLDLMEKLGPELEELEVSNSR